MPNNASIAERARAAGVIGAGGGGFPTHAKLSAKADVLVANGAECEVLSYSDQALMALYSKEILDGALLAAEATSAKRVVLAVKRKYAEQVSLFRRLLETSAYSGIELLLLPDVYPVGDEFVLTYEATGRVTPQGGIPIDVGVVVQNVTTLYNVARAVAGAPVTERIVSVAGEAPRPSVFSIPIGARFSELLRACGLTSLRGLLVLEGGPMMGKIVDPERSYVSKTTSAIVVLPEDSRPIVEMSSSLDRVFKIAKSVCDQCSFCTELCPRYLLGHRLRPHLTMRRVRFEMSLSDNVLSESHYCSECGICSLYSCPLGISPRRVNVLLKERCRRPRPDNLKPEARPEYWDRRLPASRLKARLGVAHFDASPPEYVGRITVSEVNVSLTQHVGETAIALVSVGGHVKKGQLIADVRRGALGARVHAPIDGRVASATAEAIALSTE
ncbi:MAG: 4Fe-4S dicluster domain-containing protein [Candidatus Coatesbacteria bacterium]|nr:4Fe-4S dicluster domain-containing protein [Candidatus Coatesbacteria bacterium]